jgi:hypothetical protein
MKNMNDRFDQISAESKHLLGTRNPDFSFKGMCHDRTTNTCNCNKVNELDGLIDVVVVF